MATLPGNYNSVGLPINITRGNPIPIDSTEVWNSLEDAQEYAANGSTAYVGQSLKVIDQETNTVKIYVIKNEAGDLEELSYLSDLQWEFI